MKTLRTSLSQARSKHSSRAKSRRSQSRTKPPDPGRCQFLSSIGNQCRMPRSPHHRALCVNHAKREEDRRAETQPDKQVARELASLSGEFKTASDVNHVLGKLFSLVAQRRIPRRDAVALAYIAQLLLQSLPAVQREVKLARGFDAWRETIEAALPPAEVDEASDKDEPDEALDKDEPDEVLDGDESDAEEEVLDESDSGQEDAESVENIAAAGLARALLAAARDEARDAAEVNEASSKGKTERHREAPRPTAPAGANLSLEERTSVPPRVPRYILRSPGPLEGSMQEMEVTLGEGWGLH